MNIEKLSYMETEWNFAPVKHGILLLRTFAVPNFEAETAETSRPMGSRPSPRGFAG